VKQLLAELRSMTGVGVEQYEVAGVKHWSDADLEAKLRQRVSARLIQARVVLLPSLSGEGVLEFLNGEVPFEGTLDTESVSFVTFGGAPISGTATVSPQGFVEFSQSQVATVPLISGVAYDLYGAAADVLTDWASAVKLGYDITTDGQTLKRSQRHEQLLGQAKEYRKRAVIGTAQMQRRDVKAGGRNRRRVQALEDSFDNLGLYPPSK
jgi:hypothetical protein